MVTNVPFLELVMRLASCVAGLVLALAPTQLAGQHDHGANAAASPYVGLTSRPIKALAADDIARLEAGEGMGFALAAELNHYPGPKHVLDMADHLGLSADTRAAIEAIRERMSANAIPLGQALIAAEASLDSAFVRGGLGEDELARRTAEIGRLTGELRAVHLGAHLEVRALLTDEQVARYDQMRGYTGS